MISPYQGSGLGGALMLYRENSTGAWRFVDALNHELCSPSYHPVAVDGGCMIKEYCVASMRSLGSPAGVHEPYAQPGAGCTPIHCMNPDGLAGSRGRPVRIVLGNTVDRLLQ